ncbi:MAG: flagellar motor switch protein FliN/FliY [Candidatus Endobugula sp.]|jgi:flagellar motor switch protein FliN/FliY
MSEDDVNDNPEKASEDDDWAAAMQEQEVSEAQASAKDDTDSLGFEEFDNKPTAGTAVSPEIDIILDIPVTISMEVGSTSITIRNLLQLNQGSVIELDRLAGEPLNVLVNGTLIAHGEVVVVNEKFGIRMTDVISPAERIKKLS